MSFDLATFTLIHTVISMIGIFAGLVVVGGFMSGKQLDGWIGLFLVTTFLTNLSGFGFPFVVLMPSHILGALSLVIIPIAAIARYPKHLTGGWRKTFVITSVVALYFNVFVLMVQLFRKVPALISLAPTQKEPPFAVTQLLVLVMFIALGRASVRGFRAS